MQLADNTADMTQTAEVPGPDESETIGYRDGATGLCATYVGGGIRRGAVGIRPLRRRAPHLTADGPPLSIGPGTFPWRLSIFHAVATNAGSSVIDCVPEGEQWVEQGENSIVAFWRPSYHPEKTGQYRFTLHT